MNNIDFNDIIGKRFGKLTITEYIKVIKPADRKQYHIYRAKCDCGQTEIVRRSSLQGTKRQCSSCVKAKHVKRFIRSIQNKSVLKTYAPKLAIQSYPK